MARNDATTVDFSGLTRQVDRLSKLDAAALARVEQRTLSTLSRRLPVEAARLASEQILALPRAKIRSGLSAVLGGPEGARNVSLIGSRKRIKLKEFGAKYGGRTTSGATATLYRDRGVQTFEHTWTMKSKGVSGGIFQRIPESSRVPITERSGPSVYRSITEGKHGDIKPDLREFSVGVLRTEVQRLLRVELR